VSRATSEPGVRLVDEALAGSPAAFEEAVLEYATRLAARADYPDDRRGFAAARYAFVNKRTRSLGRDTQPTSNSMSRPGPAAA
jgi:hypothetical protein